MFGKSCYSLLSYPWRKRLGEQGATLLLLLIVIFFLSFFLLSVRTILFVAQKKFLHDYDREQAEMAIRSGYVDATIRINQALKAHPDAAIGLKQLSLTSTQGNSFNDTLTLLNFDGWSHKGKSIPLLSGAKSLSELLAKKTDPSQWCFLDSEYAAPWVTLYSAQGKAVARYAYIILDEQGKLNLSLHQGAPRNHPLDWQHCPAELPVSLGDDRLLSTEEADQQQKLLQRDHGLPPALLLHLLLPHSKEYAAKQCFFRTDEIPLRPRIPYDLPEGGDPKYDINDLATNPRYGATPEERANHLATIIDQHLPHFKERDPSLRNRPLSEQKQYLYRLAAGIVAYINPTATPICLNNTEPAGKALLPLPTQIAERTAIVTQDTHQLTVESQYFLQLWNPYTSTIPAGATLTLAVHNRSRLHWSNNSTGATFPQENRPKSGGNTTTALTTMATHSSQIPLSSLSALHDYRESAPLTTPLHPNEFRVIRLPTTTQSWYSTEEIALTRKPYWEQAPQGNADGQTHQWFELFCNGALIDQNRHPTTQQEGSQGGLDHEAATLTPGHYCWECNFIPTEKDVTGHYRFVGDPRNNYLTSYLWKCYGGANNTHSYIEKTAWQGITESSSYERSLNPLQSWAARSFLPQNPPQGNHPHDEYQLPDQIPSNYNLTDNAPMAPFFLRQGAMKSISELGNINDPAQADDQGEAPRVASHNIGHPSSQSLQPLGAGGGRTLCIGKPEYRYWDHPGWRAIELLDLFTVPPLPHDPSTTPSSGANLENLEKDPREEIGLININTAPHEVLTTLFLGIQVCSDPRFAHSQIALPMAEKLATLLEKKRPFSKLSQLGFLTLYMANATTYTPPLGENQNRAGTPLAATLDRTREEGFAKFITHCTTTSHLFKIIIVGESIGHNRKPSYQCHQKKLIRSRTDC